VHGRQRREDQDREDGEHGHDRTPLDTGGQCGEDALLRRDVAEPAAERTQQGQSLRHAGPDQPRAGEREQRGHERQRHREGHDDHAHASGADGAQHGGAEQHSSARRRQRPLERAVGCRPQLLPVPAGEQQPIVDAQPESEHGDHADHAAVQVDQAGEAQQSDERSRDGGDRAGERQARGEEAAEDDDHHDEAGGQGDGFPGAQVTGDLPVDLVADATGASRQSARPGNGGGHLLQARCDFGEDCSFGAGIEVTTQLDGDEHRAAVAGDQGGRGGIGRCRRAGCAGVGDRTPSTSGTPCSWALTCRTWRRRAAARGSTPSSSSCTVGPPGAVSLSRRWPIRDSLWTCGASPGCSRSNSPAPNTPDDVRKPVITSVSQTATNHSGCRESSRPSAGSTPIAFQG
jgi:hypothetical protein